MSIAVLVISTSTKGNKIIRISTKSNEVFAGFCDLPPPTAKSIHPCARCGDAHPQNDVETIAHHGIAANVDTEDSRQLLEPQANPPLPVIVVLSGNRTVTAEKGPSYASNDAVVKADDVMGDDLVACVGRHEWNSRCRVGATRRTL